MGAGASHARRIGFIATIAQPAGEAFASRRRLLGFGERLLAQGSARIGAGAPRKFDAGLLERASDRGEVSPMQVRRRPFRHLGALDRQRRDARARAERSAALI